MVLSSIFFGHIIEAFQEMISAGPCRKFCNYYDKVSEAMTQLM
jgi:hypothetical protein